MLTSAPRNAATGATNAGPTASGTITSASTAARAAPLRPLEMAAWGFGYAALAGGLLALVHFMSHVPGANIAAQILS